MSRRLHPTHHLLYAFTVGAVLTAVGFALAHFDAAAIDPATHRATKIVVAGSETLRPMFSACAKEYMAHHPEVDVLVRGGGSGIGIAALLAGQIDVALSSREPAAEERETGRSLRVVPVARASIAVIAHPDVALERLEEKDLARLLSGDVDQWSTLGAGDAPVVVVARESDSGTAAIVKERVLKGRALTRDARLLGTHEAVIEMVASTRGAIGYTDVQLARRALPRARLVELAGSEPLLERTLFAVVQDDEASPATRLVQHCAGPAGDRLARSAGFVPLPD